MTVALLVKDRGALGTRRLTKSVFMTRWPVAASAASSTHAAVVYFMTMKVDEEEVGDRVEEGKTR